MKHMKWFVPLAVAILLLMIAIPAVADDPFGGPPSKTSGNGTTTWGAIYIGGTWDNKRDPETTGQSVNPNTFNSQTGVVSTREYDKYVTNWASKITLPGGGGSRWFKFDTVKSRDVEVYVDDVPKWGAAYRYFDTGDCRFSGVGDCDKSDNLLRIGIDTSEIGRNWLATSDRNDFSIGDKQWRNGVAARLYLPDSMQPNYFFPTPNNALLTSRSATNVRASATQGAYGGYNRGGCSQLCDQTYSSGYGGNSYRWIDSGDVNKAGDGNTHLLAGSFHLDGWSYIKVYNFMIWDNDFQLGTRYTPRAGYDFPCVNCPYPFNP